MAFFFRFYKFEIIPFGLNHDGAQDALQAIDLLQHPLPYKPYFTGGSGETLFKYYLGGIIKIFGPSVKTIKFGSALLCFLTVPVFYLMVKEISSQRFALLATFLFSISGWHITMGKTVWRAISTPLLEVVTLYFLIMATKKNKWVYYLLSGFFLALTLNTYSAARGLPIFVIFFLLGNFFKKIKEKKPLLKIIPYYLLFFAMFSITVFPLANYAKNNWAEFNSRLGTLSVFTRIKNEGNFNPLITNFKKSFLIFNVKANGDDFFTNQPLLDFPASWLFILGIIICLVKLGKPVNSFALAGLGINLLPGLISIPNGNRDIATMPFVYLISGIGLLALWDFFWPIFKAKGVILTFFVLGCLFGIINTYLLYFGPNRRELWGFYPETTIVGNFMKPLTDKYDFYLTDNYPRDALTFLTYQGGNPYEKHYQWLEKKEYFSLAEPSGKGMIFIMFNTPENQLFIPKLKQRFPDGYISELRYLNDNINRSAALLYIIEKGELYEK